MTSGMICEISSHVINIQPRRQDHFINGFICNNLLDILIKRNIIVQKIILSINNYIIICHIKKNLHVDNEICATLYVGGKINT